MTHIITADEGKWITEVGFYTEQETAPSFWHEVRTSNTEQYEEVTEAIRTDREQQWQSAHPSEEHAGLEPEQTTPAEQEGGEG